MTSGERSGRWWIAIAVVLASALPATLLFDAVLADSLTLRIKERCLDLWQILSPSQTELINPYYRPLFLLLHGLFDRILGLGDLGLRLLAQLCHLAALAALARLGRVLGLGLGARLFAVAAFGLLPGNAFTVAWPVVAYWTLAAALVFLALSWWVEWMRSRRPHQYVLGLGFATLSLFSSQTAYHLVVLAPWLAATAPGSIGAVRRLRAALSLGLPMAAIAFAHFRLLEAEAQGLASQRAPLELLERLAHTSVPYWRASFGGDHLPAALVAAAVLLTVLGSLGGGRRALFLAGFTLLSPLPFAVLGHSERYAYFAAGPASLWMGHAVLDGLPRLFRRAAPTAQSRVRLAAALALVAWLVPCLPAAWQRLQETREAARITGRLAEQLAGFRDELEDLDRVVFVNLPPMMKWHVFDLLGVDDREEFERRAGQLHNRAMYATESAYFHFGDDFRAEADLVLECDGDRLHRRAPDRPLGDRRPITPPWFLAESFEVVDAPEHASLLTRLDLVDARSRTLREPERHVVLEHRGLGLEAPLPTEGASFTFQPEDPDETTDHVGGVRLPGRLIVDLDLPRPGLLVVITYFTAEDPVHRVNGDTQRICRQISAELDGVSAPIVPIFFHSTGVVVPAGHHRVVLHQRQGGPPTTLPEPE